MIRPSKRKIILFLFSIIFYFNCLQPVYSLGNVNWILIKDNQLGKQWIDLGSLKRINEKEISILTRFFEKPNEIKKKGKTTLYVMKINCFNNKFKDTSINGIPNLKAKWEESNGDELIDLVINKSCSIGEI